jgi:4-amino-4-deoxy-L-arabinose transferase-like glycosyltransferase
MRRWIWLLPLLTVAAIFAIRVTGPPDFLDKDQRRPIDYIVDVVAEGNWVVQRDAGGAITSKPPIYTWLASASTFAFGGNRIALYLPCGLAMAALVLIAYHLARRRLGLTAALAAAMCLALAIDTQKASVLARTDAVFAATVAVAAWLAMLAWERGRGWWLFWAVCGVVSIAKSPAGVLFASGGLMAAWWGRREPGPRQPDGIWRSHTAGVLLFLLIAGGWFAWAVITLGQPVVDKLLGRELVGHVVANDKGDPLWSTLLHPLIWFFGLFMPWAAATLIALWRLVRYPPVSPRRRRFLRFMACWLMVGLLALCLTPHKRMILSLPMLLPAAVLAGGEIARLLKRLSLSRQMNLWCGLAVCTIAGLLVYHHRMRDESSDRIAESRAVLAAADALGGWQRLGAAIRWSRSLPSSIRYFTPGHPPAVLAGAVQSFLAEPGPGVVAVPAGGQEPGLRMLIAPGIDILVDREAEALLK